jgi:hypothetical protein
MKRFILPSICLFLLSYSARAQYLCDVDNTVFVAGERLEYQLFYNVSFVWIQAGTCEFKVRNATYNKKPVYQLSAQGKSYKSFDAFYRVRDTLISYVDTQTLYPMRAYKYTHEDNWHGIDDFTFLQGEDDWRITTRLKRKRGWKPTEESRTTRCGYDLITSIYRLRCFAGPELYKTGKRLDIPIRLDDGEYLVHLTYVGKERIKLHGSGYYNAHAFTISLIEGKIFKRGDILKLWISDDNNRIPLLIESPIRVGYVKAIFKDASNTRYPLILAGDKY